MFEPPRPIRESIPFWRSPRFAGAAGVAAVHAGAVALLLLSMPTGSVLTPAQREVFFIFKPAPPHPAKLPLKVEPRTPSRLATPLFEYAPPEQAPSTALSPPPAIPALGLSLFRCGPENLGTLTPEERSQCSGILEAASYASAAHEHARETARWQSEIVARNTPAQVPCVGLEKTVSNGITGASGAAVVANPFCVAGKLLDALDQQ